MTPRADNEEIQALIAEIEALRAACGAALQWVENMRIVPGGDRERLRDELRAALRIGPVTQIKTSKTRMP